MDEHQGQAKPGRHLLPARLRHGMSPCHHRLRRGHGHHWIEHGLGHEDGLQPLMGFILHRVLKGVGRVLVAQLRGTGTAV